MLHNILFCIGVTLIVYGCREVWLNTLSCINAIVNKKDLYIGTAAMFITLSAGICLVCLC